MTRLHALFSGSVQGVGFRFTARRIAQSLDLAGWVKNCYDGRVELVAEGEREVLQQMLHHLQRSFEGYISNCETNWSDATGEFTSFSITF
jgi:acylphosphatase